MMKNNKRGFSLAEILVAVVILSIALVSIFSHIIQTRKGARATFEELKGIGYAQDMIDRIKSTPFDEIPEMKDAGDDKSFGDLKIKEESEIPKVPGTPTPFIREVTIEEFDEDFGKSKFEMKRVKVRVSWKISTVDENNNRKSRDVDVILRTILRKLVN